VDEVCARARVTKGNFFYHFKSKEDLGGQLLDRFSAGMSEGFCCACDGETDPLKRLYACMDFMEQKASGPDFQGCLVGTFSQEAEAIGPRLRAICGTSFERGAEFFRKAFEDAKKKYAPRADFQPREMADFFVAAMQGSFILMKARSDRRVARSNLRMMRQYLRTLFGR
jgi:TetR/AcrR family transcriptional repressor of nem operon